MKQQLRSVVLVALVALCCAYDESDLFRDFVVKYQKQYGDTKEYDLRFEIFKANLKYIADYNAQNNGVTLGVNQFADITNEEFARPKASSPYPNKETAAISFATLPSTFSWLDTVGVVGPVENQGECGGSYEFAVVDSLSSIYTIVSGSKSHISLSPLEAATCSSSGCNGGDDTEVLKYVEEHGLSFNFTGTCPKGKVSAGVCIKGGACVLSGNETALANALIAQGPIFVGVDGSSTEFQLYETGVYDPPHCSTTQLDTALLVVGYNEEAWICQNSWGTSWGMSGYIWIARNKDNACGIATAACYPIGVATCQ